MWEWVNWITSDMVNFSSFSSFLDPSKTTTKVQRSQIFSSKFHWISEKSTWNFLLKKSDSATRSGAVGGSPFYGPLICMIFRVLGEYLSDAYGPSTRSRKNLRFFLNTPDYTDRTILDLSLHEDPRKLVTFHEDLGQCRQYDQGRKQFVSRETRQVTAMNMPGYPWIPRTKEEARGQTVVENQPLQNTQIREQVSFTNN